MKVKKKTFFDKTYFDKTYNAKNRLQRFAHRKRLKNSIQGIHLKSGLDIIDFGCGDGLFLNILKDSSTEKLNLIGFEPYMDQLENNSIDIYKDWSEIENYVKQNNLFDYAACFEVLEHFCPEKQNEALKMIKSILKKDGTLILSIPIEVGFPSVIKNIIRRIAIPSARKIYNYKNIKASFLGSPLPKYRECGNYLTHMGFDFKDLEKLILEHFIIEQRLYSPINSLGVQLNSQVFYTLKLKD